eukprot:TRINITY_DN67620_c1_g11_i1.p1 TRINITY_DN67620_c1_g11~~TRINITY_DN67620_c1_g11_i1.p1  ORF type:complete len:574 (-),score=54.36 TRINITY_DN67620_c1_g11_i1:200-1921(-)
MPFPLSHVLTSEELISEFLCKICMQLVDYPVYTRCTHVFCKNCLQQWVEQKSTCPTCNATLNYRDVGELKAACPLAWRILNKVQCKCPLENGCEWKGDYSELEAHMTSSESHVESDPTGQRAQAAADALKEEGNRHFEQKAFREAIKLYTKAIATVPNNPAYYGNRAAAWLMLRQYWECIKDCRQATELDPNYTRGHVRLVKAFCELGQFDAAASHLALHSENPALEEEQVRVIKLKQLWEAGSKAYQSGNYLDAYKIFGKMQQKTHAAVVVLWIARCELGMGQTDRAVSRTLQVIKEDPGNSDAFCVRGLALGLSGDFEQANHHFREALRLNPDDSEAARTLKRIRKVAENYKLAEEALNTRAFTQALEHYTVAIEAAEAPKHSALYSALHAGRAQAFLRLDEHSKCLADCQVAISSQSDCKPAWIAKLGALRAVGKLEEAHREAESALEIFPGDSRIESELEAIQFDIRKLKRPDYYAALGVHRLASEMEIKAGYKALALEWHPDKHTDPEKKAIAEERFKLMGEALEILTHEKKRELYNAGYDKEAIEKRIQAAERAAWKNDHGGHHHHH